MSLILTIKSKKSKTSFQTDRQAHRQINRQPDKHSEES